MVAAFRDGKIPTRGRCRSYHGHDTPIKLGNHAWNRANVRWQENKFAIPSDNPLHRIHVFSNVVVSRERLERWINKGREEPEPVAPQAHDAQPSTPAKVDQAQTYDELNHWFVNVYMPAHKEDSPNPTRDAALSAAKLEFPNYCDRTHLRDDLRKSWRDHAPKGWKRTGPRPKSE